MKAISATVFAYRQAHRLLWKHQFWKYLVWPIIISAGLTILLVLAYLGLGGWLISSIETHFFGEEKIPGWLKALFWIFLLMQFSGPLYVAFRSLVMVCYGPFLDRLSEKIEKEINHEVRQTQRSLWDSIKRPILMFGFTLSASLGVLLGGIAVGAVPLVGILLTGVLQFPLQMFLSGLSYIDPYLDRAGYSPQESFTAIRQHVGGVTLFAVVGLLFQAIPVIGWFLGPTYSVVAGVLYAMQVETDSPLQLPGKLLQRPNG